jgi:hypothetical protein
VHRFQFRHSWVQKLFIGIAESHKTISNLLYFVGEGV